MHKLHSCHCPLWGTLLQRRSGHQSGNRPEPSARDKNASRPQSSSCRHRRKRQCSRISASSSTAAPAPSQPAQQRSGSGQASPEVPAHLRNQVAKVALTRPGTDQQTDVYILGMSHVSEASCRDIEQLVELVQPDVVFAEVCRERVGLLLPAQRPTRSAQVWQAPAVPLPGIPEEEGWPTAEQVGSLLKSRPLAPVSTYDIEQDCIRLLSTGLFQSVRPKLSRPGRGAGPSFIEAADGELLASIPSAAMEYHLLPRKFPRIDAFNARVDSSLGSTQLPEHEVDTLRTSLLQDVEAGVGTVPACGKLRQRIQELAVKLGLAEQPSDVEVSFLGIETSRVEAVLKRASSRPDASGFISGFEASAVGGQGPGIQPFRPNRGSVELSPRMFLPNMGDILGSTDQGLDSLLADASASRTGEHRRAAMHTSWRPWTDDERAEAAREAEAEQAGEEGSESWSDKFSNLLTSTYGELQAAAGKAVGVPQGEAWRTALRAAARCGTAQVHLGDVPATITGERLSQGIFSGSILSVVCATVLTAAIVFAEMKTDISRYPIWFYPVTETAAWVIALLPIVAPLYEIWAFSRQTKEVIEEQVRVKEPLQGPSQKGMYRVRGEDAITKWPRAMESVIQDRDTYMTAGIKAIAMGKPAGPALVHGQDDQGRHRWRYLMPENSPPGASWLGSGEGVYQPLPAPQRIVAIVGSAHVRGMLHEWEQPQSDSSMQAVLDRPQH